MPLVILQDYLRSGGTEAQSLFLYRLLAEAGARVHLVTARPGGPLASQARDRGIAPEALGGRFRRINRFPRRRLRQRVAALQPELVILMGRTANEAGAFLARHCPDIPFAATVRTGRRLTPAYRRALQAARLVVVNSRYAEARLRPLGVSEDRIHLVRNPLVRSFDAGRRTADRAAVRGHLGTPPTSRVLIKTAAFVPGKNHQGLFAILSRLETPSPWELWLLGDGPELPRCRRLVRRYGLADRVRFLGYRADPVPFCQAADIACLTSLEESLPNFLIEAQAAGLPVVAYDVAGVRECFDPGTTGFLVQPADNLGFRLALARLLADDALREACGQAGRRRALERFSPQRQAQRYLAAFGPWLPVNPARAATADPCEPRNRPHA